MVAFYWAGASSYAIVCWQDNEPGNYEIFCNTLLPLVVEEDLEEKNTEDYKPFDIYGRVVVLNKGSIYDIYGRLVGRGGKISLKPGIYFVKVDGKVYKIVVR